MIGKKNKKQIQTASEITKYCILLNLTDEK